MYKSWKSWKLVLGYLIKSFWKNTGVQEPKTEQFEEFGAVWSRSSLCCSRSASSQRVENFRRIASLCNFCSRSTQVRAENFFKGSRARSLTARDQTLKIRSAPSGRRADRDQIPVDRDQYRDFWKSWLLNARISLILTPNHYKLSQNLQKEPTNTTLPSILAQINHNPETHSHFFSQNRHRFKLGNGGIRTANARGSVIQLAKVDLLRF